MYRASVNLHRVIVDYYRYMYLNKTAKITILKLTAN